VKNIFFLTFGVMMLGASVGLEAQGQIYGCDLLPEDNIWNTPVVGLQVDEKSASYINTIGANTGLHADFGSGIWPPGSDAPIGIPIVDVPGNQGVVPVSFVWPDESDPGPYPIPPDAPIEGGASSIGDRHVLVVDRDACVLYELYNAFPVDDGDSWDAHAGAIFDLASNDLRPDGWTSADAAGLPIIPGLIRAEEVFTDGIIRHAIRFTVPQTRNTHVWPARHDASGLSGSQYPPMGQRFRLRADFDASGMSTTAQVIVQAMKTYGMILADNGSAWFFSGEPSELWDNDDLHDLDVITGDDFEAVDSGSLMVDPDSGQVVTAAFIFEDGFENEGPP